MAINQVGLLGFVPDLLADAVAVGLGSANALIATGAARIVGNLPDNTMGQTVVVPYFNSLGSFEKKADGEAFTLASQGSTKETATVARVGKLFSMTDWYQYATQSEPYKIAAADCQAGFASAVDDELIAKAVLSTLSSDVYNATAASRVPLTWDLVCDGLGKFAEFDRDVACIIMHPTVRTLMRKAKDSTGRPLYMNGINGGFDTLAGIPIVCSSKIGLEQSGAKATTLICRKNSMVVWHTPPKSETDRDIATSADLHSIYSLVASHTYTKMQDSAQPGVVVLKHNVLAPTT